jgi:putative DNA primase/helicase
MTAETQSTQVRPVTEPRPVPMLEAQEDEIAYWDAIDDENPNTIASFAWLEVVAAGGYEGDVDCLRDWNRRMLLDPNCPPISDETRERIKAIYRDHLQNMELPVMLGLPLVETIDTSALPQAVDGLNMTDTGNAERLIAAKGEHLRYVTEFKKWVVFDETVWIPDPGDVRVIEHAKSISRELWKAIPDMPAGKAREINIAWAKQSESARAMGNAVRLARGLPGVIIQQDELDSDPLLFNVANGTLDLRTAKLQPHKPEQLHTRTAGARWVIGATAPRFEAFLETIFPDGELRSFVQRAIGYSLTGLTGEQVMFLLIGNGSNGKSTLIEAVSKMMGDYAGPVAKDLIIAQRNEAHPTSGADLNRLRLAVAMETEATNTLAEARVKALTGGDRVKARRMGEDFWDFEPTHKLWLAANYLPKISGTDEGIWRRMRVIPFGVEIDEAHRDPNLPAALAKELPGILRWAVEGCLEWQRLGGLHAPAIVTEATSTYRAESDWFPQFLDECGWEIANGLSTTAKALNNSFSDWVKANGESLNRNVLSKELAKKGCRLSRSNSARGWVGIGKQDEYS